MRWHGLTGRLNLIQFISIQRGVVLDLVTMFLTRNLRLRLSKAHYLAAVNNSVLTLLRIAHMRHRGFQVI